MTIYEVNISPDIKAKYIKEGRESALREVRARVGSLTKDRDDHDMSSCGNCVWNDCLDEIKKLINEI